MDYRNSEEGRAAAEKYGDIIHRSRPQPSYRHPRMPVSARAKIFSPFAALRGYEEEIAREGEKRLRVPQKLLPEEDTDRICEVLSRIRKGMTIWARYFKEDTLQPSDPPLGTYEEVSGRVKEMDIVYGRLCISDGEKETGIAFDALDRLEIR